MNDDEIGTIARIHVHDGPTDSFPVADRVANGWQSGVMFYPDEKIVRVIRTLAWRLPADEVLVAATDEAIERYGGDADADDGGYGEAQRQAFAAGALWALKFAPHPTPLEAAQDAIERLTRQRDQARDIAARSGYFQNDLHNLGGPLRDALLNDVCPPCSTGDHSGHRAELAGVCVGCPCEGGQQQGVKALGGGA